MTAPASVLIVHNRYRFVGGEERVVALQRDLLAAKGHRVELYEEDSAAFEKRSAPERILAALSMLFSWKHYSGLRDRIREFRPDVIHVHNIFPLLTPSVYFAAKMEGVPVVQSVHNYRFMCSNGLFLLPSGRVCERCIEGAHWNAVRFGCYSGSRLRSLGMAATLTLHGRVFRWVPGAYIAPSEFLREKLVDGGFDAQRIHCLRPAFGAGKEPRSSSPERVLLYVGRLSVEKGVSTLIDAARRLPDWTIRIVGAGPQETALKESAAHLPNVQFLGAKRSEDLPALYASSTALVLPSICYENLPSVVLEAWREGVPVIVSRMGGMAELVEDGATGFHFSAGDDADLARVASGLSADRALSMRTAIRARYERAFTPEAFYQGLVGIYRRLMGE